jgi:TfoX/Sxy family transcriptional regulator of competence genes
MASNLGFVEFVIEQMENAGVITYRKMFGEYALYCDGKIMALICDNQLFIKPTKAGRAYISNIIEAPPYPGAKPYFLIEDQLENKDWISNLVKITAEELPEPKPKSKKKKKRRD